MKRKPVGQIDWTGVICTVQANRNNGLEKKNFLPLDSLIEFVYYSGGMRSLGRKSLSEEGDVGTRL